MRNSVIDPSVLCACQVTNVDDEGVELGSGVMELTQRPLQRTPEKQRTARHLHLTGQCCG